MHTTNTRPGANIPQFVAIWEHDGRIWSGTFRMQDGKWQRYCETRNEWLDDENIGAQGAKVTYTTTTTTTAAPDDDQGKPTVAGHWPNV